MKDSFILYLEQQEIFEMLTDEQAGKLIKGIFQYERSGDMPKMDKMLTLAFIPIMQILDKNRYKYEEKCKKNKENISKRWNKKNTNVYERKKTNTNYTDNDNEYDNEYDNDNVTTKVVNKVSDSCVDGLQEVINFYNENVGMATPYTLEVLDSYIKDMSAELIIFAMKKAVEANIRTIQYIKGILNNWHKKGITSLLEAQKEDEIFRNKENKEETDEERTARKLKMLEGGLYD